MPKASKQTEFAPAKINLALHLVAKRDDGYHELDSLVGFVDVGDELEAEPTPDGKISLQVKGAFADALSGDADNLVVKAAKALQQSIGLENQGAKLTLRKHLPVGAGIGGGSADAAAALRLLNRVWGIGHSTHVLEAIAQPLGADVPACVRSNLVRMQGIGELLTPLDPLEQPLHFVLLHPGKPLSTPEVYRATQPPYSGALGELGANWLDRIVTATNDLEPAAKRLLGELEEVLEVMRTQEGCKLARMSGSGSTCFALFPTESMAQVAVRSLSEAFPAAWVRSCKMQ